MKKFFYVAVMAVAAFMVSCSGGNGSDYYKNHELQIDWEKGTVNGKAYNTETEKCWKTSIKTTYLGITGTADEYTWGTEFALVAGCETAMATSCAAGIKSSYSYAEAPSFKDSESCLANNSK